MSYDLSNLSWADFEDLVRDLIGRELGVRFEAFGPGPDGGMDGRHAAGGRSIVLQAKHYAGSPFATLKAVMERERTAIDAIKPSRYILATSRSLTPPNKQSLAVVIGPALQSEADIFTADDIQGLLRKYPDIVKAHIKLWLSNTGVLDQIIHASAHSFTAMSRLELEGKVKVYAQNPSFHQSKEKLEANHVVIISGPPGVGKTTLAEMLSYAYIGDGWEYIAIRSLDDGFAAIVDAKQQIFLFDDFLGKVALDTRSLAMKDSELARFIRRVQAAPNARFILTTRAYIFEEARRVSEYLADHRLDVTKYVLDVGVYTRRIKARILYNHIYVSNTPAAYIRALWEADAFAKIVDHKNYNPRIIEAMTDSIQLRQVKPEDYPGAFLDLLANPKDIWDIAFRTHIPRMCQHLLFALFFGRQFGMEIGELRDAFNALHPLLSSKYGISYAAKDFEEALRILEGGFVAIAGEDVRFINPSVRDYLAEYLDDAVLLLAFAQVASKADWAMAVWDQAKAARLLSVQDREQVARGFLRVADAFPHLRVWKPVEGQPNSMTAADLDNTTRISLLLEWYGATHERRFADLALSLAEKPVGGFDIWRDGESLVDLVVDLRRGQPDAIPNAAALAGSLEHSLVNLLQGSIWADDLEKMLCAIESANDVLDVAVTQAAHDAVEDQFRNADSHADGCDSESTLEEQIEALRKLAGRTGISADRLESAVAIIESHIERLQEKTAPAHSPSVTGRFGYQPDSFDDAELRNLFQPLIRAE